MTPLPPPTADLHRLARQRAHALRDEALTEAFRWLRRRLWPRSGPALAPTAKEPSCRS